jgi:hypothetical protein
VARCPKLCRALILSLVAVLAGPLGVMPCTGDGTLPRPQEGQTAWVKRAAGEGPTVGRVHMWSPAEVSALLQSDREEDEEGDSTGKPESSFVATFSHAGLPVPAISRCLLLDPLAQPLPPHRRPFHLRC